ncbi:2,3-bisphosphoglycerate-independent phosphoglycerate mutase [Crocinitomix catalasitica]|nr:2,3-bisphosphoglycerate-independent phosphoglycerate mutase [Crocinitomix catalasitica]
MKKVALIILDGWGHGDQSRSDAIYRADTPFMDSLEADHPSAELLTDGEHVGLPGGQMGNSEVGHLNIGAGRVVYQQLTRINQSIEDGDFFQMPVLCRAFEEAKVDGKKVHFIGLVSDGGVHSSVEHLLALCQMAKNYGIERSYIHAFTDGRDCNPNSAIHQLADLEDAIATGNTRIASVIGRYFAMDRDKRWERVRKAYDLLTAGKGRTYETVNQAISDSYADNVTDEFIEPIIITDKGQIRATIENDDIVICFNFRTDRCRQITTVLTQKDMSEHGMKNLDLHYVSMTNYDRTFKGIQVIYEKENLTNTIGEVISEHGLTQVRIAETEKYPHVTYFFSGGREEEFEGETRIMISSPKIATYDLQPEMSAPEVADAMCEAIETSQPNFICLNFANTDMVGHTGMYEAILTAANRVDKCLRQVVQCGQKHNYSFLIIADHGNSDFAINQDGTPNTAHSLNPVPIVVLDDEVKSVKNGTLRDVAPTILDLMGISKAEEMSGKSLIQS